MLCLFLLLPGYALSRLATPLDWRVLAAAFVALSLFTYCAYRSDKRRAETGGWRISEATLQVCALIGGWPGAFLAQRRFGHKTAKASFQVVFWLIVLIHQLVALDSLRGWRALREVCRFLGFAGT